MEDIQFANDIHVKFKDDYSKGDFSKPKMLITQYFENGKAVHIQLDERQVAHLFAKMQKLGIKPL
ncbi:MAG: hypothetical protein KDC62_10825 [Aequorivita sp.]|nr:hypothetical protein [Aequorivita sp.]